MTVDKEPSETTSDLSTLLSSATLMLLIGSLGSVAQLFEQILVGRLLSPSAYGQMNIAISMLMLCTTIAMLGMDEGISRYMPRFSDMHDVRGAWVSGAAVAGVASAVMALGLLVAIEPLNQLLFDTETSVWMLVLFILTIPFYTQLEIAINAIRGQENTIYRTYVRDLFYNIFRVGLLAALLVAGYGVTAAGYAYLVAAVASVVVGYLLLNRLFPIVGSFNTHTREILLFSLPLVLASIVTTVLSQIDTLMLGGCGRRPTLASTALRTRFREEWV